MSCRSHTNVYPVPKNASLLDDETTWPSMMIKPSRMYPLNRCRHPCHLHELRNSPGCTLRIVECAAARQRKDMTNNYNQTKSSVPSQPVMTPCHLHEERKSSACTIPYSRQRVSDPSLANSGRWRRLLPSINGPRKR